MIEPLFVLVDIWNEHKNAVKIDDVLFWTHELTEMFLHLVLGMNETMCITITCISPFLESKHLELLPSYQRDFLLYHVLSPYGNNCLIGVEENGS